jgi:DNA-binding transcriptional ArsR family regulator
MVQHSQLDRTMSALADPTRRAVLERLGRGSATISELAAASEMSLTGLKKHVGILEEAELVRTEKRGRTRHCYLGPRRLDDVTDWVEAYRRSWDDSFDRLDQIIQRKKGMSK